MPLIDSVGKAVTIMTKPDAKPPIYLTEGCCVTGRTRMSYKRGGEQEARERLIEELCGTVSWLWGAKWLNDLGDWILGKTFKNGGIKFDVGSDIMRRPFDNFAMKKSNYSAKFTKNQVAVLKGVKVISAILLANIFVGAVVPKANQALSRYLKEKKAGEENNNILVSEVTEVPEDLNDVKAVSPSFTGLAALNKFTNIIENTNTGKLVATDVGIAGGRVYNARKPEERLDIGVRDIGSMYFYYWARGHAGQAMNLLETGGKTSVRLDPQAVNLVSTYLEEILEKNGGKMSVEEFSKLMHGEGTIPELPNLVYEKEAPSKFAEFMARFGKKMKTPIEAIELEKFLAELTPEQREQYEATARRMSELQPKRAGISILSKNQIEDIFKGGELNSPKFLHKLFDNHTEGKYSSEYRYISHRKLYEHKDVAVQYVDDVIAAAKNGEIDSALLRSMKNKNLMLNGLNFLVGIAFSVAFLSTLIPMFQQYVTRTVTGKEGFPGDDDFGKVPANKINTAA